ncbi:MAG TPA: GntR family transcriptional regulator [Anaerolineaceae bacterium]|nr:GntR family transcriptional regulator [Anaerolineaceae bacterium]
MDSPKVEALFVQPLPKNSSLANMAYESIREAIITGRIKPGERIGQVELAKQLGVSERTVREALARLVAKGLAMHEPFKGVRVAVLPLAELREVYVMRALLEGRAMELAAGFITDGDLQRMRELLPLTVVSNSSGSVENAQEKNREFHWIPIRAAGSRTLARILEQLWEMMFAYELLYQNPDELAISRNDFAQHKELLEALEARNGKRAAQINSEHIYTTIQILLDRFEAQQNRE